MSDSNKDDKRVPFQDHTPISMKDIDDLRARLEAGAPLTPLERFKLACEAKEYKWADQMSLKELEALVERLQAVIASIKKQSGHSG